MTLNEIAMLLGVIRVAYPNSFRDMQESDRKALMKLWERQFAEYDYKIVETAIDSIISVDTSGFMPSIGRIKEEIIKLTTPKPLTEEEAWNLIKKAINGANSSPYSVVFINGVTDGKTGAQRNFEQLPEELQRIVGSPRQLAEWAGMNHEVLNSVVASNFMRTYRARIKNEREFMALPREIRQSLETLQGTGERRNLLE